MSYSAGMLKHRVLVQNRKAATQSKYGLDADGPEWEDTCCIWAAVDFVRGMRAMREGALDVYGVVMIRCRYTKALNDRSRIVYEGKTYQILGDTFHADPQANTIQFNAQAIVNDKTPAPSNTSETINNQENQ